jgi:hypothetical protein
MGKLIARDVKLVVAGVDLSSHVQDIDTPEKWNNIDVTGMGAKFMERLLGIGDFSVPTTFFQDYGAGSVHATLQPLAGSNTPFKVEITPVKSLPVGATNPRFVFFAVLDGYTPVKGKVGEASTMQVTFYNAEQSGVLIYTT